MVYVFIWYTGNGSFCTAVSHSHSVPNKFTGAYINYKLSSLLFKFITNYLLQLNLTYNSYLCLAVWLGTFSHSHLASFVSGWQLCPSAFPLPRVLLVWSTPPILPTWNHHFIELILVTKLYSVQKYCPGVHPSLFLSEKKNHAHIHQTFGLPWVTSPIPILIGYCKRFLYKKIFMRDFFVNIVCKTFPFFLKWLWSITWLMFLFVNLWGFVNLTQTTHLRRWKLNWKKMSFSLVDD